MTRVALLLLVSLWGSSASSAELEYKEGETFRVVLASGAECEVRVARRRGDSVIVNPVKPKQGCPTETSMLPLGSVTSVKWERSKASAAWRGITGGALIAVGGLVALAVGIADGGGGERAAAGVIAGGMVAGGILVVRGGHHWSVQVNQEQLEPAL